MESRGLFDVSHGVGAAQHQRQTRLVELGLSISSHAGQCDDHISVHVMMVDFEWAHRIKCLQEVYSLERATVVTEAPTHAPGSPLS